MPYIKLKDREALDETRIDEIHTNPANPGQLNYKISGIIDQYLSDLSGPSYSNYNDVIGVLECIKLELYRRFVGPYEDQKLSENGEVFYHDPNRVKLPHVKDEVPLSRRYTDPSELDHV